MNTKEIEYFSALVNGGSFAEAGRRCGLSRSVLYRYLQNLENELGVELFERGSTLKLTKAGEIYYEGITSMQNMISRMYRTFETMDDQETVMLRIGYTSGFGSNTMKSLIPQLFSSFPGLRIYSEEDVPLTLWSYLDENRIDSFISVYDKSLFPRTKLAQVAETELLLTLPSSHPLVMEKYPYEPSVIYQLKAEDIPYLKDTEFICSLPSSVIGSLIDLFFARYDIEPRIATRLPGLSAQYQIVCRTNFGGFFSSDLYRPGNDIQWFRLPVNISLKHGVIFREDYEPTDIELYLYWLLAEDHKSKHPQDHKINSFGKQLYQKAEGIMYGHKYL